MFECVVSVTIFGVSGGGDDGHGHHDEAGGAPDVLHKELLQHDVPQTLQQDLMDLRGQRPVAPLQLLHLHLPVTHTVSMMSSAFTATVLSLSTRGRAHGVIASCSGGVYLVSSVEGDLLRVGDDARVHVSQVAFPPRLLGHQLPKSRRAGAQDFGGERHHQASDDGRPCCVRSCVEEDHRGRV